MTGQPLKGKTALVTGGSRGVGAGIVARLAADGAAVAFTYARSHERADAVAAAVVASGGTALPIRADSMHEKDVEAAVTRTVERFGSLDILVNNAAVGFVAPITELTMDEIDAMLTINVRSAIVAIRQSLAHMGTDGRIINIGGMAEVFAAYDQALDREVAVKVLLERFREDENFVRRFQAEARHVARMNHPNLVGVFDTGTTGQGSDDGGGGQPFIVMELVEGRSLQEAIEAGGLTEDRALEVTADVGGGRR
jgi:NAD(P)-dependent dehydrogenase (short-subunit alcohol dehydrogenase family)